MKVVEVTKGKTNIVSKKELEEKIAKMRKEDEKLVKGKFEFVEAGAGEFTFPYRFYPGLIQVFTITHGETCELPLGVVRHLNNTYKKIRYYDNVELDSNGKFKQNLPYTVESRVKFTPSEYL